MVDSDKSQITHVSVNSRTTLKVDDLVSSYEQVNHLGTSLAAKFFRTRHSNKVVLNLTDHFQTNNNCGFNLANFKPRFIRDFFQDVVQDYERSFIGSFASALFRELNPSEHELYFTIAKFSDNMGFSLTENSPEAAADQEDSCENQDLENNNTGELSSEERRLRKAEILRRGAIPEFVKVTELFEIYKYFTEANLKNKILVKAEY